MPNSTMRVLLGAGGPISTVLVSELLAASHTVRLVSRRGAMHSGADSVRADLLDPAAVLNAIPPGSTAYLVAGLRYHAPTWEREWPRVMSNAIAACSARGARLVFFDNVYMYGRVAGPMTENTPVAPCSRKGRVRARIAADLLEAAHAGKLQACIARSADFYGPGAGRNSVPNLMVFDALARGRRPSWLGNPALPHSFTYVPDCGPALARLATSDDAWGRVWHLPTASPAITGLQFIELAANAFGRPAPAPRVITRLLLRFAGLFNEGARDSVEMFYQFDEAYAFDSSAFEQRFGLRATSYADGIAATARSWST